MEIKYETVTIPAKTYTVEKYIAKDGKEFSNQKACENYEWHLNYKAKTLIINSFETAPFVDMYGDANSATLYYIKDEQDIEYLAQGFRYSYITGETDFNTYGEGWYICFFFDGGDCADSYHLMYYNNYLKTLKDNLKRYEESNALTIATKDIR